MVGARGMDGVYMVRPKNGKKKAEIVRCAAMLFRKVGYTATTYQAIADEMGESRALIQHYFPQKSEFATIFFSTLSHSVTEVLDSAGKLHGDKYIDFYLVSQVYYAYLTTNEPTKLFVEEVLGDRCLSDEVLLLNLEWMTEFLREETAEEAAWSLDSILVRGGGLLTFIHYWLPKGRVLNVEPFIKDNIVERMAHSGMHPAAAEATLAPHRIDEEEMAAFLEELDRRVALQADAA